MKQRKYHVIVTWYDMRHKKHNKTWAVFDTAEEATDCLFDLKQRGYKCVIAYL